MTIQINALRKTYGSFECSVDELFIETQPAHLQKGAQLQKMTSEERDSLRADIIRAKLAQVPQPDISRLTISTPEPPETT